MKVTKSKLKRIITEELQNILSEVEDTVVLSPDQLRAKKAAARDAERDERQRANDVIRKRIRARTASRRKFEPQAERIMNILYPDASREEMKHLIRGSDDEATLATDLFGFMFPTVVRNSPPKKVMMDRVESWIASFDDPKDAAFEIGGRTNTDNIEALLDYNDEVAFTRGKEEFRKAKAYAEKNPARNVPVGRSASPDTAEYDELQSMLKADIPPRRKKRS